MAVVSLDGAAWGLKDEIWRKLVGAWSGKWRTMGGGAWTWVSLDCLPNTWPGKHEQSASTLSPSDLSAFREPKSHFTILCTRKGQQDEEKYKPTPVRTGAVAAWLALTLDCSHFHCVSHLNLKSSRTEVAAETRGSQRVSCNMPGPEKMPSMGNPPSSDASLASEPWASQLQGSEKVNSSL